MDFPLPIPPELRAAVPRGCGVLVALSGGVDSSVALAMLRALGAEVAAVTFKNFCYAEAADAGAADARSCCSLEAIEDARRVARLCGATHWVADVTDLFRREVIDPFVADYAGGRTPNPCLACNARVRFPELVRLADRLGCALVATGHYARCVRFDIDAIGPADGGATCGAAGEARLLRAVDPAKDQAYFLYGIGRELLPRVVFPLGWSTKSEVRRAAAALGLPVARKPDSQEICFVPGHDRSFLFESALPLDGGEIVDRAGHVLGRHRGLVHYTVGQRRGLGIGARSPLYVLALDQERDRLVVGPLSELAVRQVTCDRFVPAVTGLPDAGTAAEAGGCLARIRHRHVGARVAGWRIAGDSLAVDLAEPAVAVAPGQALVLYRDDLVLGGGRIVAAA
jgi:tRNA-specific 2-thiouridylase